MLFSEPQKFLIFLCILPFLLIPSTSLFAEISNQSEPLYFVFLMDASGSVKKTDPDNLRVLAAQTVISLLTESDKVAIVEFSSTGEKLLDFTSIKESTKILTAVKKVSNNGAFTDFRAGLEQCNKILDSAPPGARKVILLLSDGMFEPNLFDGVYTPHNIHYRKEIIGKSKAEKKQITRNYNDRLLPVAHRIIDSEIIPELHRKGVEVYSIGLSNNADKKFLDKIAERTSKNDTEVHSYYAVEANDLIESFIRILTYTQNKTLVFKDDGLAEEEHQNSIFIDEYLENVLFILVTDINNRFKLKTDAGQAENKIQGTHDLLRIFRMSDQDLPGNWRYGFEDGSGPYHIIIVGKSTLEIEVSNLKRRYLFGDIINANVKLLIKGKDARGKLHENSCVKASLASNEGNLEEFELPNNRVGYLFEYEPAEAKSYTVLFDVRAIDKKYSRNLLPRLSKQYKFTVAEGFFVEPDHINYGDLNRGGSRSETIVIYSGYRESKNLVISFQIDETSVDLEKIERSKLPKIEHSNIVIHPGKNLGQEIKARIPEGGRWGDYAGKIKLTAQSGTTQTLLFSVHVPSFWEKIRLPLMILILILIITITYFVYIWGHLGRPKGILRPLEGPSDELLSDITLSRVKHGLLSRYLNWKKHIVTIGRQNSDINLRHLPTSFKVNLMFFRFATSSIVNASIKESGNVVIVQTDLASCERNPGQSFRLRHGTEFKLGDYLYRYENY